MKKDLLPLRNTQMELSLLKHVLIRDCLVLIRKNDSSKDMLVAYVVAEQELSNEELELFLGNQPLPDAFVFMTCLPFTEDGSIDYDTLLHLDVVDDQTVKNIEQRLENLGILSKIEVCLDFIKSESEETIRPKKDEFYKLPVIELPKETAINDVPALVSGPSLEQHVYPLVLNDYLIKAAESNSNGIYFIKENRDEIFVSYSLLLENAKKTLTGLKSLGLSFGDKLIIQLRDEQDFLTLFWACLLGGIIPLPIAPLNNNDPQYAQTLKIISSWKLLDCPHIISDEAAQSYLNEIFAGQEKYSVTIFSQLINNPAAETFHNVSADDIALILMTSGSTDNPKIVTQTHRSLTSRSYGSALTNNFTHKDIFLNWFPLDHVGGIVMFHIQALSVGANQIQAPMSKIINNPLMWLDLIEKYKATVTWAPNFAYNLVNKSLNQTPVKKWNLSSMRFILNGGEEICADQAAEFLKKMSAYKMSKDCMFPSWGMSETCSGVAFSKTFYRDGEVKKGPVEIGDPIPSISFRIVGETGNILNEEEVGLLEVKGLPVTLGYYKNDVANKESFSDDGWFKTGDKGIIKNGKLTITGRDKNIIIINGLNHTSSEIEAVIESIEDVKNSFTAAIGVRYESSTTDQLVIFFAPNNENYTAIQNIINSIRRKITQTFNISPQHIIPVLSSDIPKTSIGKIQHSLLRKKFQEGAYHENIRLFDRSSLLSSNSFVTSWHKKDVSGRFCAEKETTLILMDEFGIGEKLITLLKKEDYPYYQLVKRPKSDDQALSKEIRSLISNNNIRTIINLWTLDKDIPEQNSIDSVNILQKKTCFTCINVLHAIDGAKSVTRLINCSNFSQKVDETDQIAPAKASIIGILKSASKENPHLCIQHVDLSSDMGNWAQNICDELGNFSKDIEISYRNKERFVRSMQPFSPKLNEIQKDSCIKKNGLYVVTGGLGGIGFELAKFLLENYEANLLIVGRTEIPDRNLWQQYIEDGLPIADKINNLKKLQALGKGKINYISGDIYNQEFIQKTLKQLEKYHNTNIVGIFHLAGEFEELAVKDINDQHLSRILDAKTLGAWNLYQYAKNQKHPLLFVSFSSSNGYLSGPNVGAYSAANTFLEALSTFKDNHHIKHLCLSWSMWDDIGMSKGYAAKEITKIKGYNILKSKEALDTMEGVLNQEISSIIIGIDGNNIHIQPSLFAPSKNQKGIHVYYKTIKNNLNITPIYESLPFYDRFNHKLTISFHNTTESNNVVAFNVEDNRKILTQIWMDVLEIENVAYDDNFFDLGGHSLLMMRVQEKINEKFLLSIEMIDLFKFPTINLLSQHISSHQKLKKDHCKTLSEIWANILEFDNFTAEDNFFDLGGHSLLMVQVREQIKEKLGVDIEMIDLFKYPTIKNLSAFMDKTNKVSHKIDEPTDINNMRKVQRNYRYQK